MQLSLPYFINLDIELGYKWHSAILPRGCIHFSIYPGKFSLKSISTLISILKKENMYGTYPSIISKLP